MQVPLTWAAFAALLQLVPALIWAGGMMSRVDGLERYRESHKLETVHRQEFDRQNVQVDRIEAKLDALILELRKR